MEKRSLVRNISLKDLWDIFVHRLAVIILVAVLAVGVMFSYIMITYVPEYKSTATLYILKQQNENSNNINNNAVADFSLALNVVNDCTYFLKSHAVLDKVIEELNLDMTYGELYNSISTSNPENTRILAVTVVTSSPEKAKTIVDCVCKIGANKIISAMGFNQVNLYEYGTLDDTPCNRTGLTTYCLVGIAAAVITYLVFLLIFLFDDRIRTDADVEKYLGLSILGDIPNDSVSKKHSYGYYAYSSFADEDGKISESTKGAEEKNTEEKES